MKTRHTGVASALVALGLVAAAGQPARASGFQIRENSAASLGNAFAGAASAAEDLSTIYNNPAGMTRLSGNRAEAVGSIIVPSAQFEGTAARVTSTAPTTVGAVPGRTSADAGTPEFVPSAYAMWDARPDLKFGLAITAPFGLETTYPGDWVGRYNAVKSSLRTVNVNPNVAYKVNNWLSVGAGVDAQYADAELTQALNFAFLGQPDGFSRVTGNSWGFGWNAGVLLEPVAGTRVGLTYRSAVTQTLEGNAQFQRPAAAAFIPTIAAATTNGTARAQIRMPDTATFSVTHALTPRLDIMGEAQWTHWQTFRSLVVQNTSTGITSTQPENWVDTVFGSVGATWRPADKWTLRTGVAYDPSPVKNQFRTARIPDQDRLWLSFGAGFKPLAWLDLDAGYTHIFVRHTSINETSPSGALGGTVVGGYSSSVDIVSLSATARF